MKNILTRIASAALLAAAAAPAGTFYGLWWDGSSEHFGTVNPYTAAKTSLATIPGVKYISPTIYAFDPDSSRYVFVGGNGAMDYIVLDAPTGSVIARAPRTDNLIEISYNSLRRRVYGLSWVDSSLAPSDSGGHPRPGILRGAEYFVSLNPFTGGRDSTLIPGVKFIRTNSHVLDTDSGRYVFAGTDTAGVQSYYVLDVDNGALLAKIPHTIKIDNPVYDPATGSVHGLWWSDSSLTVFDTLGRPHPSILKGTEYFVTLKPDSTVSYAVIPGVKWITLTRALDVDSGRYVFEGRDTANVDYYYVIDVETGAVISQTAKSDNINGFVFASSSSTAFPFSGPAGMASRAHKASAWSLNAVRGGISELKFENLEGAAHAFSLLDLSGRTVLRQTGIRSNTVRIDGTTLKPGAYFFHLREEGANTAKAKGMLRID